MTIMTLAYAVCRVPCAPLRKEKHHRSEMVSQILFGEKAIIKEIDENSDWVKIMCEWDHYEGWVRDSQLTKIDKKAYTKETKYLNNRVQDGLILDEQLCALPLGASLFQMRGNKFPWYPDGDYQGKKLKIETREDPRTALINDALRYRGAPYLWGGRTQMGIDCSGLTQMAFRFQDKALYRDASQQIIQGEAVDFLSHARPGDLAFFDNEEGIITHVGILMGGEKIIHATDTGGGVVIDTIDNGGIISHHLRKRTHQLRMIRNILGD